VLLFGPGPKSQEFQSYAAERDSTMLLNALIFRGIQVDGNLLCLAARYDSTRVIDRLVERSVPVNVECNRRKATALYTAVEAKQHRSAKILVEAGAKADLPDISGNTPLDLARRQGDERMIRILTQ
jgi:ankyrin repeat protein